MHARVIRIKGSAQKVDDGAANFKSQAVPALKEQEGYAGSRLFVNRETGDAMVITFWQDEGTLRASDEALRSLRSDASARFGAEAPRSEHFEAAVQHRPKPTEKGNWVRITSLTGDPAKVDDGIRHFESEVVPSMERQPGVRAMVLLVDRRTGAAIAASVWDSKEDLERSDQDVAPIRAKAAEVMGATNPNVESYEVEFAELLAAVRS